MGRWSNERRAQEAAKAAATASEAGRTLQARQQVAKAETSQPEAQSVDPKTGENERPDDWKPEPRNEPRRMAMEELEAKDAARRGLAEPAPKQEIAENPPPPTPESMLQGGKFTAPPAEPEKEDSAAEQPPEDKPAEPVKIETVRVKVDGEEFDAPKEDVEAAGGVRAYQIEKAGENRLKKSNEVLAEAKRIQAEIARMQEAARPKEPQLTNDQFMASKMDAVRFGNQEESAAALREILQRTNPQINQQDIIEHATIRIRHDNAADAFRKEFQDVTSNVLLNKLASTLYQERLQEMHKAQVPVGSIDWTKVFSTIGNEVRTLVGRPSQPAQTPAAKTDDTTSQPDKEARKASIVNLPTAGQRAELPKDSKPETREDILNWARKSRGLPTG